MEMYFLKSAACLAVLLLFYKLLLEKENMHVFKRFYLLTSVLAAIVIPLITFTTYVEPASEKFNTLLYSAETSSEVAANKKYLSYIFFGIYLLGVLFFTIKFFRNLRSLMRKIRINPKVKAGDFINVLLSEKVQPHTFFSFIFFNKQKFLQNEIPQDVKIHEEAHARQKHSLDVIFIELLQIIFWFNPLMFLLKDAMKLNHEFLADREVIKTGISTSGYQQTLLAYSSRDLQSDLVNPINYSSIKKRFTVMKTKTSKKTIWARSFLLLPLLAVLLYGFSSKEVVEKQLESSINEKLGDDTLHLRVDDEGTIFLNNIRISLAEIEKHDMEKYNNLSIDASPNAPKAVLDALVQIGINSVPIKEVKVRSNGDLPLEIKNFKPGISPVDSQQEKATPKMIAEYNKLAKYYGEKQINEAIVQEKGFQRMLYIYGIMTEAQRKDAEKLPPPPPPARITQDNPPPPPPPAPPTVNAADAPPPPPPPSYEVLVERGATFYYNGKEIKPEEARKLVEVDKTVNVQILDYDGKPEVRLTDKKED